MAKLDLKAGSTGTSPAARRKRQSGLLGRSSGGHPGRSGWRAFLTALPFISPSFFGVIMFLVVPVVVLFYLSFENWNLISPASFAGFNNYINIFRFDDASHSLGVTLYYVLLNIPLQTVLALILAVMLNRKLPRWACTGSCSWPLTCPRRWPWR